MLYQKFRRIELGLTQREVARRTDINRTLLSHFEVGRMIPRPDELARLAKVLGCDPARLRTHVSEASLGDGAERRDAQEEAR